MKNLEKNDVTIRITKDLLRYGSDPNISNHDGALALHLSSQIGDIEMMKILMDNHAKLDIRDQFGVTPLMAASVGDHVESCRLLIERGADVNLSTKNQNATALTAAIANGNVDIVKLLVESEANIEHESVSTTIKDPLFVHPNDMLTGNAIELADQYGHKKIAMYLDDRMKALRRELEVRTNSIKSNPEVTDSFSFEDVEEILSQNENQNTKIEDLLKENEGLNNELLEFKRIEEKISRTLDIRFKFLYKTIKVTERTLKQVSKLDEKTLLKFEEQLGLLHNTPDKVKFRDKIYGTEIYEKEFNRSGRIYIKKNASIYEIVCVGDKGSQSKDINYLKRSYSSRNSLN